jgi:hypothetical protein
MQSKAKLVLAAAACLIGAALTAPASAQQGRVYYPVPYSDYRGPDGRYDSLADYTRDVRGIPCGITCTQAARQRWGRYNKDHDFGR